MLLWLKQDLIFLIKLDYKEERGGPMEIKTILGSWKKHEKFDRKVNRALAAGWKFHTFPESNIFDKTLTAIMIQHSEPNPSEAHWKKAVRVLRNLCTEHKECTDCPANDWCRVRYDNGVLDPEAWPDPL